MRLIKKNAKRNDKAWLGNLLDNVLPDYARKAGGKARRGMLERLENVLRSYPSKNDVDDASRFYSHRNPRMIQPESVIRVAKFLRVRSRQEYIRTGSTDYMETYFGTPAILLFQRHNLYVPEDLDRIDYETLHDDPDLTPRIRLQMEAFWTKRTAASLAANPVDDAALLAAATEARNRLGKDGTTRAAALDLATAIQKLLLSLPRDKGTDKAEELEREAKTLISTTYWLLTAKQPEIDAIALKRLGLLRNKP